MERKSDKKFVDLYDAIDAAQRQHSRLNHREEVVDFLATHAKGSKFESILSA